MRRHFKNLFSKTPSVVKKGTVETLCMVLVPLIVLLAMMGCDKVRDKGKNFETKTEEMAIIKDTCEFDNPLTDLPWLKDIIDVWKQNGWHSIIYQCTYKDGIGFLMEPCVGCPDVGYNFVNCEGVVLCSGGGFLGKDNCSEFNIDFENRKLILEINN